MNILFFLTPKVDVAYIYDTYSLRQEQGRFEFKKCRGGSDYFL